MKRLLSLLFILMPMLASATDVNFSLKDGRYGTANFANRTIWLQYLSAPTSYQGNPAIYSKIITNTDVNGTVVMTNMLPGLWSCSIQAPPDSSTFFFVVLSDGLGLINAGDYMVLKTSNQYVWANSVNKLTSVDGSVTLNPTNGLGVVDLHSSGGVGSQTPWTQDINGAGHSLTNVNKISVTNQIKIGTSTISEWNPGIGGTSFSSNVLAQGIFDTPIGIQGGYGEFSTGVAGTGLNGTALSAQGSGGLNDVMEIFDNITDPSLVIKSNGLAVFGDGIIDESYNLGAVPAPAFVGTNNTQAAAGSQQVSPSVRLSGNGWATSAGGHSKPVYFDMYVNPIQGNINPTAQWTLGASINGGALQNLLIYDQNGALTAPGQVQGSSVYGVNYVQGPLFDDGNALVALDANNRKLNDLLSATSIDFNARALMNAGTNVATWSGWGVTMNVLNVTNNITNQVLTANQLVGADANKALIGITAGSGLSLSGGTLTATGGSGLPGTNTAIAYGGVGNQAAQTNWSAEANGGWYETNKSGWLVAISNGCIVITNLTAANQPSIVNCQGVQTIYNGPALSQFINIGAQVGYITNEQYTAIQAWPGPTNYLAMTNELQTYSATSDMWISNYVASSSPTTFPGQVTLFITNGAATNCTLRFPLTANGISSINCPLGLVTVTTFWLGANTNAWSETSTNIAYASSLSAALTGDVTTTAGSLVTTLKNTGTAGTYTKTTFDAQGRETSGTSAQLASADFANQGTTTTVLHGNASGNPSFGAVALGDMANLSGNSVIGNNTGSSATPVALSPSQVLDIIGTTRGSFIERGASTWGLITPSATSGWPLVSQGTGADPAYAPNGAAFTNTPPSGVLASNTLPLTASYANLGNSGVILWNSNGTALYVIGTNTPGATAYTNEIWPNIQSASLLGVQPYATIHPLAITNNDSRAGGFTTPENVFVGSLTSTNGVTNQTLTANTVLSSGASSQEASIANGTGWLHNNGSGTFAWSTPAGGSGLPGTNTVIAYGGDPATASQTNWSAESNGTWYETNKTGKVVSINNGNVLYTNAAAAGNDWTLLSDDSLYLSNGTTKAFSTLTSSNVTFNAGANAGYVLMYDTKSNIVAAFTNYSFFTTNFNWLQTNGFVLVTNTAGAGQTITFGGSGITNGGGAQYTYMNLQRSTNCGWGGISSNGVANSTLTLNGYEEFVVSMGNTIVQLGDATTNVGHHIAITCGSTGTNAITTVSSQKINGATKWTNTLIFSCTQLISDGSNWQICGSRGN